MPQKNIELDNQITRNILFRYFDSFNIKNYKIIRITKNEDIMNIKRNDYNIYPAYNGARVWLMLYSYNNIYYFVSFSRHILAKRSTTTIFPINNGASKKLYSGTLMEATYFSDNNKKFFIVNDIHCISNEDQSLVDRCEKIKIMKNIFRNNEIVQHDNCIIRVGDNYKIDKFALGDMYEKIKLNPSISEIMFYPNMTDGTIYHYTITPEDIKDKHIRGCVFLLRKKKSDAYEVINTKTLRKIDLAYIPDLQTSKMCAGWFKDNLHTKELLVMCYFDNEQNKWIPKYLADDDTNTKTKSKTSSASNSNCNCNSNSDSDSDSDSD
jgi:hypothetical protein